jgi:uncharacterized FlaG/YvyC family protein
MDQILHRKLIIEKNNLQLEVAKANKEIAKLMETVQQYEAVLASLNEAEAKGVNIPEKIRLRGQNEKAEKKEEPKSVQEATLVRGMEAAKLKAKMSGKKLPTKEEAAEAEKQLKIAEMKKKAEAESGMGSRRQRNQEVQEGFKDFVKDMGSQLKTIGKDALANVKKDMGTMKAKVSPANIKAGVKALPGKIEAAAQKMPTQQQNINFVKNTVVPMIGRVGAEMQRNAPKNVQKRNASINRMMKP